VLESKENGRVSEKLSGGTFHSHQARFFADLEDEGDIVGWAETEVDASIEECATWAYLADTREKMKSFENSGGLERVITKLNDHCQIN